MSVARYGFHIHNGRQTLAVFNDRTTSCMGVTVGLTKPPPADLSPVRPFWGVTFSGFNPLFLIYETYKSK